MCIYYQNQNDLTYEKREHVLPAALGCHTKLESGIVSDQANEYFSPLERSVLKESLILLPRIFEGPGKRGKLSSKKVTASAPSQVTSDGDVFLGYIKKTGEAVSSHSSDQFIINSENKIRFQTEKSTESTKSDMMELRKRIVNMGEKYVPVNMPDAKDGVTFIACYDNKIHIGCKNEFSGKRLQEIQNLLSSISVKEQTEIETMGSHVLLELEENPLKMAKVVAKTAINTLAWLMGGDYIIKRPCFNDLISAIFSDSSDILNYTKKIYLSEVNGLKQKIHLSEHQHTCILHQEANKIKSLVIFYNLFAFEVTLADHFNEYLPFAIEGIVCDWKIPKDYRYTDYLTSIGILTKSSEKSPPFRRGSMSQ